MSANIDVRRAGRVTIFTITRPERMNATNAPTNFEMSAAIDAFAADPEQWVGIITGQGDRAFSAGNDIKQTLGPGEPYMPPAGVCGMTSRFDLEKPMIAAVNGIAMGGGFETALSCDLIVASENAEFALPEGRIGTAAMGGGLLRLPMHIGPKRAMDMILTRRRMGAREAFALGLVNEVVPVGKAVDAALAWAERICESSPMSVRASKSVMKTVLERIWEDALVNYTSFPAFKVLEASEDRKEGTRAFIEKRQPIWHGR